MESKIRNSGIDIIGKTSWGTHFCLFYQTKEDLIDILVPYFKAGLENNEYCMWVTSEPLNEKEAERAIRGAMPNFDEYFKKKQIEIVHYTEWYLRDGVFDLDRVLNGWVEKIENAIENGFEGLRVTGNTAWLEDKDWKDFRDYEEEINNVIGNFQMMAICTYSLEKCGSFELLDVIQNHQFALIRREGKWESFKSMEQIALERKLKETELRYRTTFEQSPDGIIILDLETTRAVEFNIAICDILGYSREEFAELKVADYDVIEDPSDARAHVQKVLQQGRDDFETKLRTKNGDIKDIHVIAKVIELSGKKYFQSIWRDITERKKTERKLKESEEKFKALFENTNDAIFIHDRGSQFIEVNQTACEKLGYTRKKLLKLAPKDIIPPGFKIDLQANIKALQEKGELMIEAEHITKDGIIIPVEINSRVFNFGGKQTIISVVRDITERKVVEQELKESEEKWRALSENSPAHIMLCDREHKILFINRTVPDLSKEEVIGTPAYNYIPQKERQLAIDYRDSVWETGEPITYTTKYKTKKGDTRYFDVWHSPVFQNGKITALVSQHMDITEHKKAEEALEKSEQKYKHLSNELEKKVIERTKELKESEQKFRKMISELDVGYFNIGMDGKLIFHNSAFNKIGGYNVSENFIGKIGKDFWVNPIEFKHYMEQILKNGSIENFIARVKKKNGEGIFIELNSHLVRDMNGNPTNIEGTFIDVTQKFEYEKKLREQNLRLKEINEFKTNLMNRTSHELQTPLISILGFTDIILHKYKGKLDPDLIEYLEIINKKSYYLTRTIRSLIDTAYLEKDILQINVYKEDLALLFRDCVKHLDRIIKFRNQSVILNVNNILITNFDKGTIHRVFESLLENAINNTPSGGKIEVRSIIEEDFYIISVKDNGIGLLKKEVRQLFKPFGKIERYGKGVDVVIDGTGLSLYISKRIIELHGGKIWVKSKGRNLGSTFFFSLPIVND